MASAINNSISIEQSAYKQLEREQEEHRKRRHDIDRHLHHHRHDRHKRAKFEATRTEIDASLAHFPGRMQAVAQRIQALNEELARARQLEAEQARQAEEVRRADEARQAEQARHAEAARQAAVAQRIQTLQNEFVARQDERIAQASAVMRASMPEVTYHLDNNAIRQLAAVAIRAMADATTNACVAPALVAATQARPLHVHLAKGRYSGRATYYTDVAFRLKDGPTFPESAPRTMHLLYNGHTWQVKVWHQSKASFIERGCEAKVTAQSNFTFEPTGEIGYRPFVRKVTVSTWYDLRPEAMEAAHAIATHYHSFRKGLRVAYEEPRWDCDLARIALLPPTDPERNVRRLDAICIGLVNRVAELHARGIVHRDIKPGNTGLIGDEVILGDFGCMARVGESHVTAGTPLFTPPELLNSSCNGLLDASRPVSFAQDIYALGATMYILYTKKFMPLQAVLREMRCDAIRAEVCPTPASRKRNEIFFGCLQSNPNSRIGMADLQRLQVELLTLAT